MVEECTRQCIERYVARARRVLRAGYLPLGDGGGWEMGFTFTYFPRIGLSTWRIDYVFHSPHLVALRTAVGDYGGLDHMPVIATLAFRVPRSEAERQSVRRLSEDTALLLL